MSGNRGVVYHGKKDLRVESFDFPRMEHGGRKLEHAAVLKVVSTNICGSDQHIYRGRFTVPQGHVLGHEITGEIVEKGVDVELLEVGDLVSVPFNVACGRCGNCKEGRSDVCENDLVNPDADLGAFGFDLKGWAGGQAEYVMVPYADYMLMKFKDKDLAMEKIRDLTLISDILPTGFHGAVTAGVRPGSHVYIAGAGPVGRCAAAGARLLGAACIIVGDQNPDRLKLLRDAGFETVDLRNPAPLRDQIEQILGQPEVDAGVDAVGFEAHGLGSDADSEQPHAALNSLFDVVRASGKIGVPGIYVGADPDPVDADAGRGRLPLDWGKMWTKSIQVMTGMAPVQNYNRYLTEAILWGRMPYLSKALNVEVVTLDQAPNGYARFDEGSPSKFVIDPHGMLAA